MTYTTTNDSPPTEGDYIMVPMRVPCGRLQVSDGYHTFGELYQHCDALFARLCQETVSQTCKVLLDDFVGHAIYKAVIRMPKGWVYRQLPVDIWDRLHAQEERVLRLRHPIQDVSEYNYYAIECLLGQPMPALKQDDMERPDTITLPGGGLLLVPCPIGQVSDGTNTFDDLYAMRHALFVALCHEMAQRGAWKSLVHEDGTSFDDYFIAGIELPQGMVTYHLPMELWDTLKVETLDKGRPWDGHTAADVVQRLLQGL